MTYKQTKTTITINSVTDITTDTLLNSLVVSIGNVATLDAVGVNDPIVTKVALPLAAQVKDQPPPVQLYKTVTTHSFFLITEKESLTVSVVKDIISSMPEFKNIETTVTITVE